MPGSVGLLFLLQPAVVVHATVEGAQPSSSPNEPTGSKEASVHEGKMCIDWDLLI